MADLLQYTGGVKSQGNLPETWTAPTSLFDTADRTDSAAGTFASATSRWTAPSSGLPDAFLFFAEFEYHDTSNGRFNPQARFEQISGTGTFESAFSGGYNRDTSEDRSYVATWAIYDQPSASATVDFQWKADADDATGGTERSNLQVIPIYYSEIGIYVSTSSALYGGTTPNQVTGFTASRESNTAAIEISSNVVTLKSDNADYLVLGGQFFEGRGGRTQRWHGFRVDGTKDDSSKAYSYYRNTSNDESGDIFSKLVRRATTDITIDQFCYRGDGVGASQGGADVDGSTPGVGAHVICVIELNSSAEVFTGSTNADSANLATTGPIDVSAFPTGTFSGDSSSFTRVSDTAVNAEQAMDLLFGFNVSTAQNTVAATQRWTARAELTVNGTEDTDFFAGDYMRNNQGSRDTFGWSANLVGVRALSLNDDVGFSVTELAGSEGGGGNIDSNSGWASMWGVNLDTLQAGGNDSIQASTSIAFSQNATVTATGYLAYAGDIVFSESATLSGLVTKGAWQGSAIAPYVLPIAPYTFTASGGPTQAATSIAFSETANLSGRGGIQASESVSFTASATIEALGVLQGAEQFSFSESASLTARASIQGATSIDLSETAVLRAVGSLLASDSVTFSETASLTAIGQLQGSTSIDFSASGLMSTGLAGSVSVTFSENATLGGIGALSAAASFAFSESADLNATGQLSAAESIAFSENATLSGDSGISANTSIAFSENATAQATGRLAAQAAIDFSESATASATGSIAAATSIAFGENATLSGGLGIAAATSVDFTATGTLTARGALASAISIEITDSGTLAGFGDLAATTSIAFSESAAITGVSVPFGGSAIAPYVLPIRPYVFSPQPSLIEADTSIAFSENATLTAIGALRASASIDFSESATISGGGIAASTSVDFSETANLTGVGRLAASTSIGFSESADIGATGDLSATTALSWSETAQISATAEIQGATTIAFSTSANLGDSVAGRMRGSTSLDFGQSATLFGLGRLSSTATVSFGDLGQITATGRLIASTSIDWSVTGSLDLTGDVQAATSIDWSESALLTATGQLAAQISLDFSTTALATQRQVVTGEIDVVCPDIGLVLSSTDSSLDVNCPDSGLNVVCPDGGLVVTTVDSKLDVL